MKHDTSGCLQQATGSHNIKTGETMVIKAVILHQAFHVIVTRAAERFHVAGRVEMDALTANFECMCTSSHHLVQCFVNGYAFPDDRTWIGYSSYGEMMDHRVPGCYFCSNTSDAADTKSFIMDGSICTNYFRLIFQIGCFIRNQVDFTGFRSFNITDKSTCVNHFRFSGTVKGDDTVFTDRDLRGERPWTGGNVCKAPCLFRCGGVVKQIIFPLRADTAVPTAVRTDSMTGSVC